MRPERRLRAVIDTNVLISQAIRPNSIPARAVDRTASSAHLLFSASTWAELEEVLLRRKFDHYMNFDDRQSFLHDLHSIALFVDIPTPIRACRDPKDDKFLEVAVHGRADLIVTGDTDLLALHPFRGIAFLTPTEYLEQK